MTIEDGLERIIRFIENDARNNPSIWRTFDAPDATTPDSTRRFSTYTMSVRQKVQMGRDISILFWVSDDCQRGSIQVNNDCVPLLNQQDKERLKEVIDFLVAIDRKEKLCRMVAEVEGQ